MTDFVRQWFEGSAYGQTLGAQLRALDETGAELVLPFNDANANPPANALHGGVAASLSAIAAQAVARCNFGPDSGPWHTAGLQINYLAAALGEDVAARARLLRRGKDLCFVEVETVTADGKAIAQASAVVRARHNKPDHDTALAAGDDGAEDLGPMGPRLERNPFISGRGITGDYIKDGRVRLSMPWLDSNSDASGGVHEGAALALLDTAGAMCAWSVTGIGPYKASTPSMQIQLLAPPPRDDLIAYGRVAERDGEFFWNDIEVAAARSGRLVARGVVMYRLITS